MKLDLSKGQLLRFAYDGTLTSGVVVDSQRSPGLSASVTVVTDASIPENAQLTLLGVPGAGDCGQAHPILEGGHVFVKLAIGYAHVEISTLGT
jgi:hypothetical protein